MMMGIPGRAVQVNAGPNISSSSATTPTAAAPNKR
jgi:hypothetical protein